jgi:hypothetical protein
MERLTGSGGSGDVAHAKTNGTARVHALTRVEVAAGEKLTTEKLEGYLWSAGALRRGVSLDDEETA